jgi:hypothetical protein
MACPDSGPTQITLPPVLNAFRTIDRPMVDIGDLTVGATADVG